MNKTGYKKVIDYLNRCLEHNYLSHAYIFYGPDEISKQETAYWFANKILNNKEQKWHPDLFAIKPELDENATIGLIRQLKNFLTLKPHFSEYKIALIEAAEKLNSYAQNALLKIFEEAPSQAIIILGVKTLDSISAAIVSRGVKLSFWRIPTEAAPQDKTISDIFELFLKADIGERYKSIEKLDSSKAPEFLKAWLNFLRTKFKADPTKKITALLAKSQNIYFKLNETNLNPKFAYDELLLSLTAWKP